MRELGQVFGTYLHHLCAHAPQQYEVVPLRSINIEYEERLFGQAKQIAQNASNWQPEKQYFNRFVRLSASKVLEVSTKRHDTQVSWAATHLPPLKLLLFSSILHKSILLTGRLISPFWYMASMFGGIVLQITMYFMMKQMIQSITLKDQLALLHYQNANVESVSARSELSWSDVIKKEIKLAATVIRLYDQDRNSTGELRFETPQHIPIPLSTTPSSSATDHTSTRLTPSNSIFIILPHTLCCCYCYCNRSRARIKWPINKPKSITTAVCNKGSWQENDTLNNDGTAILKGANLDSLLQEPVGLSEASDSDKLKDNASNSYW